MIFKKIEWSILVRVLLLFVTLCGSAYLLFHGPSLYLTFTVPVTIYQVVEFYRFQRKVHVELDQFVESVHYRDFSRHFDV